MNVVKVIESWLHGLAEQIIIWCSDSRSWADGHLRRASHRKLSWAWLPRYYGDHHASSRYQTLAATHHSYASGYPTSAAYHLYGEPMVRWWRLVASYNAPHTRPAVRGGGASGRWSADGRRNALRFIPWPFLSAISRLKCKVGNDTCHLAF